MKNNQPSKKQRKQEKEQTITRRQFQWNDEKGIKSVLKGKIEIRISRSSHNIVLAEPLELV